MSKHHGAEYFWDWQEREAYKEPSRRGRPRKTKPEETSLPAKVDNADTNQQPVPTVPTPTGDTGSRADDELF